MWRPAADAVTSVPVATVDWRTLVARHGPFDLVVIDAEGFDGEIVHLIDLSARPPGIIIYEHCHLTRRMRRRRYQQIQTRVPERLLGVGVDDYRVDARTSR